MTRKAHFGVIPMLIWSKIFSPFFEETQKIPEKVLKITLIQILKNQKRQCVRCLFLITYMRFRPYLAPFDPSYVSIRLKIHSFQS